MKPCNRQTTFATVKRLGVFFLLWATGIPAFAQQRKTFLKINLPGLAVKNYHLQVERMVSRKISLGLGVRYMPETPIPFREKLYEQLGGGDQDLQQTFEQFRLGNFTLTPEFRIYAGKRGTGRGFYLSLFYRYARFNTNNLFFDVSEPGGAKESITLAGNLSAHTGGLMIGAQWLLGKILVLDWWIGGVHGGNGKGIFSGTTSYTMDAAQQDDLRESLNSLDIPFSTKTVTVSANTATMTLNGPWVGLRAGLAFGIRL